MKYKAYKIREEKHKKIGIIVSNYNNGKYIDECFESLINQTNPNWTAYIMDDGSTDNSKEISEKYQSHRRMHMYFSSTNRGLAVTHNDLIKRAKPEIIGILDPDDALYPNAIDTILKYYQSHPEADFVYSQFDECDINMNKINNGWCKQCEKRMLNPYEGLDDFGVWHFKTFKKRFYGGIKQSLKCSIDTDMVARISEKTQNFHFIDTPLYKWRNTGNSLSTGKGSKERLKIALREIAIEISKRRNISTEDLVEIRKNYYAYK